MDIIKIPFGYLLDWLCQFSGSYGVALILFSLVLKLILFPMSCKSKKSMLKMSRLSPRLKALEIECGEDKEKLQKETAKLYKEEGVSMFGGCLWSLVPLLILIPLYYVIREPITYLMHYSAEQAQKIVDAVSAAGFTLKANKFYQQLEITPYIMQYKDVIAAAGIDTAKLHAINFNFLGIDLGVIPDWKFWTFTAGTQFVMFLIPVVSAASQLLSMLVSQKMSDKVATNSRGEQEENPAASSSKTMMWLMPAMSLYFCFIMPAALSVYWTAQAVFGTVQDVFLTLHYRKVYAEEDRVKQQKTAEEAALRAERERIRAERIAANGGETYVDPNTSKKKMRQKAQQAAQDAADAYAAAQAPEEEPAEAEEDKHFSGDPERPYCRGRAYKPNRYGRKDAE